MPPAQPALTSCLNILRRTLPGDSEKNVTDLASLLHPNEETAEELFQLADPPLRVSSDDRQGRSKPYILCEYNRDGDSFRNPWSNEYEPPLPDGGFRPTSRLRDLEKHANEVWDAYRAHYYESDKSVGSVYLWNKEDESGEKGGGEFAGSAFPSFAGAFLIRKDVQDSGDGRSNGTLAKGYWNSVHVVDIQPTTEKGRASYQLTGTISLSMRPDGRIDPGETEIGGSLVRQVKKSLSADSDGDHIVNIGGLIEELELDMRTHMDSLYIQKTREVVDFIRTSGSEGEINLKDRGQQRVAMMLTQAALSHQQASLGNVP